MANPASITIASGSGNTVTEVLTSLDANATQQLKNWADTSAPSSPSNGQTYIDNTTAARLVGYLRQDGAWAAMILTHILEENLDCDGNQLVNALLEKLATGSLPTAGASTEARACWDSTLERGVLIGSASRAYVAECAIDGSQFVRIPATFNVGTLATPATEETKVTKYTHEWTLDAAAEELNVVAEIPVPAGYTSVPAAGKDITLEVDCLLLNAETANDDIDLDGTFEGVSDGAKPGDDSASFDAVTHDIGSNNGQYDRHRVSLTVDYDAPSANIAAGDTLMATINHDATGQVAGVIVVNAFWRVPVLNYDS